LGASQDNISGLIGLSAIVNKNLVFTLGLNMQEHSILKGQYEVGQDVGSEPIDSDVLEDKTFKTSTAFVLSFKFE
jgi:hypothetical protein